jgi:hypothetical protein
LCSGYGGVDVVASDFAFPRWQAACIPLHFHYVIGVQISAVTSIFSLMAHFLICSPGVPSGKLSDEIIHTSRNYDGMKSEYWIYIPRTIRS